MIRLGYAFLLASALSACSGRVVRLDHDAPSAGEVGGAGGEAATDAPESGKVRELQALKLQASPLLSALQVDDQRVYFLTGDRKLQSCLKTSCDGLVTYSEDAPRPGFALAEHQIAFLDEFKIRNIYLREKNGDFTPGISRLFADSRLDEDAGLAFGDGAVHWLSSNRVYRCAITGCGTLPSASRLGEGSLPRFLGQASYWVARGEGVDRIRFAADADASIETLFESVVDPDVPESSVREAAIGKGYVYWLDGDSRLLRCPLRGCAGAAPELMADVDGLRSSLRVDASGVYWLESPTDAPRTASLRHCPHDECATPRGFEQLGHVTQYALDDESIFVIEVVGESAQTYPEGQYFPGSLKRLVK